MPFPTGAELAQFLVDAGVLASVPGDLDLYESIAEQSRLEFERDTGWSPFLATGETRYWDPNGTTLLDPGVGILSVACLELGGEEQTLNSDYWLLPYNGFPKTLIRFASPLAGEPRSVSIVGTFGYASEIPQDAYRAVITHGAALATAVLYGSGGLKSEVQEGDVRYKIDTEAGRSQVDRWASQYRAAVKRYRRVGLK